MSDEEIQRMFGDALAARPPAPRQFLLYFLTGGDELTAESRALLPQIVEFVRGRAAADVTVIGHTDTTDTAQANAALGLRRATLIRNELLAAGLNGSQVDVSSHGETDLLVATADNVAQPRNRRVEVTVR
jgi:peptidoglycan-associated lipoprotein